MPVSACFSAKAICSSVYRVFFAVRPFLMLNHKAGKLSLKMDEKIGRTLKKAADLVKFRKLGMTNGKFKFDVAAITKAERMAGFKPRWQITAAVIGYL
jgi:hypothetical protein